MRLFGLSLIVAAVVLNLLYCLWANPLDYPYSAADQVLGFVYLKEPGQVTAREAGFWGLVVPISMLGAGMSLLFSRRPAPPYERADRRSDRIR